MYICIYVFREREIMYVYIYTYMCNIVQSQTGVFQRLSCCSMLIKTRLLFVFGASSGVHTLIAARHTGNPEHCYTVYDNMIS